MTRFEQKGFKLVGCKEIMASKELLGKHYAELASKPFFNGLVEYMSSGPVVAMVWEGDNVVASGRKMLGATKPSESAPGTIRGDFGIQVGRYFFSLLRIYSLVTLSTVPTVLRTPRERSISGSPRVFVSGTRITISGSMRTKLNPSIVCWDFHLNCFVKVHRIINNWVEIKQEKTEMKRYVKFQPSFLFFFSPLELSGLLSRFFVDFSVHIYQIHLLSLWWKNKTKNPLKLLELTASFSSPIT